MFLHTATLPQKSVCLLLHRKPCSFQTFETKTESTVLSIFFLSLNPCLCAWWKSLWAQNQPNHLWVWPVPAVKQTWGWWVESWMMAFFRVFFFQESEISLISEYEHLNPSEPWLQSRLLILILIYTDIDLLIWLGLEHQHSGPCFFFPFCLLSARLCWYSVTSTPWAEGPHSSPVELWVSLSPYITHYLAFVCWVWTPSAELRSCWNKQQICEL